MRRLYWKNCNRSNENNCLRFIDQSELSMCVQCLKISNKPCLFSIVECVIVSLDSCLTDPYIISTRIEWLSMKSHSSFWLNGQILGQLQNNDSVFPSFKGSFYPRINTKRYDVIRDFLHTSEYFVTMSHLVVLRCGYDWSFCGKLLLLNVMNSTNVFFLSG